MKAGKTYYTIDNNDNPVDSPYLTAVHPGDYIDPKGNKILKPTDCSLVLAKRIHDIVYNGDRRSGINGWHYIIITRPFHLYSTLITEEPWFEKRAGCLLNMYPSLADNVYDSYMLITSKEKRLSFLKEFITFWENKGYPKDVEGTTVQLLATSFCD